VKNDGNASAALVRAGAIAFATALVTMSVQVLVHRIVSVKLVNNFAFLVISLTMLGFAFSGVVLSRWREPLLARRDDVILLSAALFPVALVAASMVFCRMPPGSQWAGTRGEFLVLFARLVPLALVYAIPFAFCGLILGLLLSAPELPTRTVYFWDLAGSALGAFAVIPAIMWIGVERSMLAAAALLVAACLACTRPRARSTRVAAVASLAAVALSAAASDRVFRMSHPQGSMLAAADDPGSGVVLEHVAWDPVARIEVSRIPPPDPATVAWPFLVGDDPLFLARFERVLTQNNNAFTYALHYDGRPEMLRGIERTLYSAAYQARTVDAPRVLVIGVGGGFDLLAALHHGASRVTGVEVNAATVRILTRTYQDYFRHWVTDPRVRLVAAEGRNFLAASREEYDLIQLSGVDSVSGIPGAAHVFSENYVYTAEAFDLYLARLSAHGVLSFMRQEWRPPREMLRVLLTTVEALRRAGVSHPADHVVMLSARSDLFTTLLAKRTPFTPEEIERVETWAATNPSFYVSAAPGRNDGRRNLYQVYLALSDPAREAAFQALYPFDVRPVRDDRPFFFKHSTWGHLFPADAIVAASVPALEYGLILLLAVTGLAALACVYLPLRHLSGGGSPAPGTGRYGAFFAAIGVGYMAIEIALVQKYGLLLGHPNLSLSVVLAALLLATGVGALASVGVARMPGGLRTVGYTLAALILLQYALVFPHLAALMGRPLALRVALVIVLILPVGACLGAYFPAGLQRLKGEHASFAPWAWGINGIFSVIAPILAVALATTWGANALLIAAIPIYLAAGFVVPAAGAVAAARPAAAASGFDTSSASGLID
jgi:spermidine synthase